MFDGIFCCFMLVVAFNFLAKIVHFSNRIQSNKLFLVDNCSVAKKQTKKPPDMFKNKKYTILCYRGCSAKECHHAPSACFLQWQPKSPGVATYTAGPVCSTISPSVRKPGPNVPYALKLCMRRIWKGMMNNICTTPFCHGRSDPHPQSIHFSYELKLV